MEAHAIDARAARAAYQGGIFGIDELAHAQQAPSGALSHGGATANRGGVELGKQRFFCQQWIGIARIGIGCQATPYEKAAQAANDTAGDALYLLIVGRRQRPETGPPAFVGVVDAIENQRVVMEI
jgi:hypothetical protein